MLRHALTRRERPKAFSHNSCRILWTASILSTPAENGGLGGGGGVGFRVKGGGGAGGSSDV